MDQRSVSATSNSSIRPSLWQRLTRLSSAPNSPQLDLAKKTGQEAFNTPSRRSGRKTADDGFPGEEHSDDEQEPITPNDVGGGVGSSKPRLHSRIHKPTRTSSLRTTSTNYSVESIKLLPTGDEDELDPDDNGHAAVLAGFLKNNGGYLDQSDSDEDFPPPPPILHARSRYIPSKPIQTRARSIYSPVRCPDLPASFASSSFCSPVRSNRSLSPRNSTASKRVSKVAQKSSSTSSPCPKAPEVVKRRVEGQKAFRSLVLGEDDMLRSSI